MRAATHDVRILSVRQPWASAIAWGLKPIENRTKAWPSTVPVGTRIFIHASQRVDGSEHAMQQLVAGLNAAGAPLVLAFEPYVPALRGVILASVVFTGDHYADDCLHRTGDTFERNGVTLPASAWCSRWAEPDAWHWRFADPVPLDEPIPAKGRLGLWTPDDQLAAALEQAVAA